MSVKLDEKALEAAHIAILRDTNCACGDELEVGIRAYLAAAPAPADVAGLVEFLRSVNSEQAPYANDLVREKCHEAAAALTSQAVRIKQLESANSFLQRNFCDNHNQRKTAERERDEARAMLYQARHAMLFAIEAIETGRSEPLFIARDNLRNTLDDISPLAAIAAPGGGDEPTPPQEASRD